LFIARLRPAAAADLKILGFLGQPLELVGVALHHHQGMADIDRVIGAESEFAAGLQLAGEHFHRAIIHHATLGMARLGPWVGMQQIEHRERTIGNAREHLNASP
jgi:hypothetical protein